MKLIDFYNTDASSEWFSKKFRKLSVHDSLRHDNFRIIEKETLQHELKELEIPVSIANMSWGGQIPRPAKERANTFISRQMFYLKKETYDLNGSSRSLADLVSTWMDEKLTGTKFLVSLNPAHYLVTSAGAIAFDNVFTVSRTWNIDSWIGVFDETQSILFLFDIEFSVAIISCDQAIVSDDMQAFSRHYNSDFNESFVRECKTRSGIDPQRAQEYFDKIYDPAIRS